MNYFENKELIWFFFSKASSPTPSNISTKSKSGRNDWKRLTDPNKKKINTSKIAQIVVVYSFYSKDQIWIIVFVFLG